MVPTHVNTQPEGAVCIALFTFLYMGISQQLYTVIIVVLTFISQSLIVFKHSPIPGDLIVKLKIKLWRRSFAYWLECIQIG